jgi:hypothetical protein
MPTRRRLAAGLVAGVLTAPVLSVATAPPAAATTDRPWSGYRIARDGTAAGGWIGGRKVGARKVYRLDPAARPATRGFRPASATTHLTGSGPRVVTRRATARAAWVLSKYGDYRYAVQAAAVDVTLHHLLVGGRYRLSGPRTAGRIRQTEQPAMVRDFARTMLGSSRRYAGPYRISVAGRGAVVGGFVTVRVRVTARRTGAGIRSLPLTVRFPGADPVQLVTDDRGRARTEIRAALAGDHLAAVTVHRLPEHHLFVRRPRTRGASRVAIAGFKWASSRVVAVPVRARPSVSVDAGDVVRVGRAAPGTFTLSDGTGDAPRTARGTLFGPFAHESRAGCDADRAAGTATTTVTTNGTYRLPPITVTGHGYYTWRMHVERDRLNLAATTCGGSTVARVAPHVTVRRAAATSTTGSRIRARLGVQDLPAGFDRLAAVRLYGPYAARDRIGCGSGRLVDTVRVRVDGDGGRWSPRVPVRRAGYYGWKAELPGSEFTLPVGTRCRAADTVVRVTPSG